MPNFTESSEATRAWPQVGPLIHIYGPNHSRRPIFLQFVSNLHDRIVAEGLISEAEFIECVASRWSVICAIRRRLLSPTCSCKRGDETDALIRVSRPRDKFNPTSANVLAKDLI